MPITLWLTLHPSWREETEFIATSQGNAMTMQFTGSLHADGWWDHMPPGHRVNPVMNPEPLPSSSAAFAPVVPDEQKARMSPRRLKRSHASAWILLAAVGATGGALAVAVMHDPQGMREHLHSAMAEVKGMAGSSTSGSDSSGGTEMAQATAPVAAPEAPPVAEPAPVVAPTKAVEAAQSRSLEEAPLPPIAPAAGRRAGSTSLPAAPTKHLSASAESVTRKLADTSQAMPSLPPPAQLAPPPPPTVEPQPMVQAPPAVVTPLPVPQSEEVAPPPAQAPASAAQR